ncbi:MAG TPA: lipoprotein [Geminicoccaceae bacterium]
MPASRSASAGERPGVAGRRRLLALLLAAALAGCGKKGRLELPDEKEDDAP